MRWSVGDKVMAKWPGSGLYYHAEIKSIDDDKAEVLYSDGTEMEIPVKFMMSEEYFAPRKRSKSATRSRRRSKSPGRSPSRKGKSLKAGGDSPTKPKSPSASRGRRSSRSSVIIQQKSESISSTSSSDEKISSVKQRIVNSKVEVTIDSRYMTRQRQKDIGQIKKPYFHKDEFKDFEYGGVLGAFVMYLISPIGALLLLLVITKANWDLTKFTRSMIPCSAEAYFNAKAFAVVLGFLAFHAIIYALPLGHIMKGPAKINGVQLEYKIGARYTFLLSALTYGALFYCGVPLTYIHDEMFHLAVASIVVCFLGTFLLYIASFWAAEHEINPAGNFGSLIYDSFIGRITHPRIGKLFDLKLYLYRPCMTGWLVYVWVEMYRNFVANDRSHSIPFLLVAVSQIFYIIMVFFYDEDQCPYMFDIKNESLGFPQWIGELTVVPFLYSLQVQYLVDHNTKLKMPVLIAFILFTVAGYYFLLASQQQKTRFRKNPFDHQLSSLESIPASRPDGDRLLMSGLWGFVRNPNYLGEILIGISWSSMCGITHLLPWYYPVMVTLLLGQRTYRVEERNIRKHGHSWIMYCEKVKYKLIPGIF